MILIKDNFLHLLDLEEFKIFAEQIDAEETTKCIKANWYWLSTGDHGFEIRLNKEDGFANSSIVEKYHFELDTDLQDDIYRMLEEFFRDYKPSIDEVGRQLVSPEFDAGLTRVEFQYTDKKQKHSTHAHSEALAGTIYVHPTESKGTIFVEPENVIDWSVNRCVFQTSQTFHYFENRSEDNKRFTINFFVRSH